MAQGRSSEGQAPVAFVLLLCLLVCIEDVHSATYVVGDSNGWDFNVASWPDGKSFKTGDTLVFNYDPALHSVVVVKNGDYSSCNIPTGAEKHTSGKDRLTLAKGQNYFICGTLGHCDAGMKIAVNAV